MRSDLENPLGMAAQMMHFSVGTAPPVVKPRRLRKKRVAEDETWGLERLNEAADKSALKHIDLAEMPVFAFEGSSSSDEEEERGKILEDLPEFFEYREPRDEIAEGLRSAEEAQHDPQELLEFVEKLPEPAPVTAADDDLIAKGRKVAEEVAKVDRSKLEEEEEEPAAEEQDLQEAFRKLGIDMPDDFLKHLPPDPVDPDPEIARKFANLI